MGKNYSSYTEFIVDEAKALLSYDSPSGYGKEVTEYLLSEFSKMGIKAWRTVKGGVMADLEAMKMTPYSLRLIAIPSGLWYMRSSPTDALSSQISAECSLTMQRLKM